MKFSRFQTFMPISLDMHSVIELFFLHLSRKYKSMLPNHSAWILCDTNLGDFVYIKHRNSTLLGQVAVMAYGVLCMNLYRECG
jgi:hypothetical protein